MKNKTKKSVSILFLLAIAILIYPMRPPLAIAKSYLENKKAQVESRERPDIKRSKPIPFNDSSKIIPTNESTTSLNTFSTLNEASSPIVGPNLIINPSFESTNSQGNPSGWSKGGYGTNDRTFSYPVTNGDGTKAAKVSISNYSSGDAKWYFNDVTVEPGAVYEFSDFSLSTVPSIIDVRYKMSDGSFKYSDIAFVNQSSSYQKNTVKITIPENVVSLTIFHLIKTAGSLTVDNYSLNKITTSSSPNLVQNGDFEIMGTNGSPAGWNKGGYGTSTREFFYGTTGVDNSKSASINVSNYSSGDAKWYFNPIQISPGTYNYSDKYISNVRSIVTVQFLHYDGKISYKDIASLPPASSFANASIDFTVDASVKSITIFHLIKANGNLNIDNVSLMPKTNLNKGVFSTGAVTLRFDDGWLSQYQNAIPKMTNAGINGTFYIATEQTRENGFLGYMSKLEIKDVFSKGNEIGAHTRTHASLTNLPPEQQQEEIEGSRADLISLNVGPIFSFAYPFGEYNDSIISMVKNAGFKSALSTIDGFVLSSSDKYQLERQNATVDVPISQIEGWINDAQSNKKWLIIAIHRVDNSGELYSITPSTFNQIIDYLIQKQIPVVTITEGLQSVN